LYQQTKTIRSEKPNPKILKEEPDRYPKTNIQHPEMRQHS